MDHVGELWWEDRYLYVTREPEMTKFKDEWVWSAPAVDRIEERYRVIWQIPEEGNDVDADWDAFRVVEA